jgi:hypothetical protein
MLHARRELDASGLRLTWLDGEVGDVGLPLSAPTGWGFDFQRRLERHLRREELKFARVASIEARASSRSRARRWFERAAQPSPSDTSFRESK